MNILEQFERLDGNDNRPMNIIVLIDEAYSAKRRVCDV